MAIPNSRGTLKEYCLRNLGKPVIDINVDDDQVEDRIDEALQYFSQYHYDGIERMYLKYKVTADDVTRMRTNVSDFIATDKGYAGMGAVFVTTTNPIITFVIVSIIKRKVNSPLTTPKCLPIMRGLG